MCTKIPTVGKKVQPVRELAKPGITIGFETLPYRMLIISNYLPITVYRVEDHNHYFHCITGYITGFHESSL